MTVCRDASRASCASSNSPIATRRHAAALRDISFEVEPGKSLAIIGRVGSGKSTVLRLLVRSLDPEPGAVHVDGHDVRDYPLAGLREQVALVPQDTFLFGGSFRENVSYDDPERGVDAIWEAAEVADLRATAERFEEGLETVVGERGVTLSGGQKQRTALARGVIRNAPVLLLDDCFSSVDTETEDRILARLRDLRAGKTTLLVSHRVSTVRHADNILVLDAGRVVERGSHAELLAAGAVYANLEQTQSPAGQAHGRPRPPRAGEPRMSTTARDHSLFDAELDGRSLDYQLLWRLLGWLRPHAKLTITSLVLVLLAATLTVLTPVVLARVVIDGVLYPEGAEAGPTFGMQAASDWLGATTGLSAPGRGLPALCAAHGGRTAVRAPAPRDPVAGCARRSA